MRIFFVFLFLFFSCLPLFCRDVTVTVKDSDLDLPLEGATIKTRDGNEYKCNYNGVAVIKAPDDRQLIVIISYPGYETDTIIVPASGVSTIDVSLKLSGIIQGKELVVEAQKPGANETKTGRSVAISGREIAQSAEIGIIEDVMNAIKLLPGVGYSGTFNAQPSIRGGFPGDMSASLDGYYVFNPYHWGGGVSIFDPRMVQSAQLSHGVFSARYGHTITGLLDITTKNPSNTETEFEFGLSTSTANFNISFPFGGKGGIMVMGRTTFYDPIISIAKEISKHVDSDQFDAVNSIRTAPYIRSTTITGNYRFTDTLELNATGFFGMDGVGVSFINEPSVSGKLKSSSKMIFDFTNYQGFIITGLKWNPDNDKLLKFSLGTGFMDVKINGDIESSVLQSNFSPSFSVKYGLPSNINPAPYERHMHIDQSQLMFNAQGRVDFDWEIFDGFLAAAGIQEMFTTQKMNGDQLGSYSVKFADLDNAQQSFLKTKYSSVTNVQFWEDLVIPVSVPYPPRASNNLFVTSVYTIAEYSGTRIKTELGLRLDHYFLLGKDFSLNSTPAFNPRLNIDFNIFKNILFIDSFNVSLGTGLFSTVDDILYMAEKQHDLREIKPNRVWTSILGTKFEFIRGLSLNIETYYKYVFDRMYIPVTFENDFENGNTNAGINPKYDGEGMIWGIDIMIQKLQSRYWDGWISYSFNYARYRDPSANNANLGFSGGRRGTDWYFPRFHRYHNLNLVLNFKPSNKFNIYTRFGIASGVQKSKRVGNGPESYPMLIYSPDGDLNLVERYRWESVNDESSRTPLTLPMDIKFSFFGSNKSGKSRYEIYFALENVLALAYKPERDTSFNSYTGEVDTGSGNATYGIPIPIPSFGFKLSY